ncbi:zinc-ribbon domain-containing protein [Jannaschia ovalis]|uniref:Zinc-ribbon domain-containing protein n=1 Tax=Jannaschia ovalis TaxID=3038773 RepID=A0ABY8LHJ4_9RHOB|nr:zinc-ribbon domain-containing protein [Jannaschia sp. GRR-S6-38]WGH79573.1 zinc-ribbon domain-containing protein [Jannaschia sp. GRR-S6-38]
MRITCPNCNAQYEVADDLIPAAGRDVQCSNCSSTWFQDGRPRQTTAVEERAIRRPGRPAPPPEPEPEAEPEDAVDAADAADAADADDVSEAEAFTQPAPGRRPMADDDTRDILRAEREREERLRARARARTEAEDADADMDMSADTGAETGDTSDDDDLRSHAAAERARMAAAASVARSRDEQAEATAEEDDSETPEEADAKAGAEDETQDAIARALRDAASDEAVYDDPAAAGSEAYRAEADEMEEDEEPSPRATRRELLPDIEEINSSLRPDERALEAAAARGDSEADDPVIRRSGFRAGFLGMGALILLAVGGYVFSDMLARAVPALSPQIEAYVGFVDTQRSALEAGAEALVERLTPDA